ncbi:phasin family protein [Paraburkholderia fungorum]|uniref:Phasin family protein n=1 Tax=Paraburkholderia fungorum TaxID=134537 RepID=A0AAW3V5A4_9BURK|nr:phasin family protein [Paraburkholderia fungorum]MBB4517497.1 phasin family protein [Paraburkholderia fungorum]MBB6204565.1 phasin family protein [Paraburkholderia fungorum]
MNQFSPEHLAAVQNAQLESLFGLTNRVFDGVQKLLVLNLQVFQSMLVETQQNAQKALAAKDAEELLALQAGLMQPAAGQILSYSRRVLEIASATQAEFTKVAGVQCDEQSRRVQTFVDKLAENAPTGSEAAVAAWKSALATTQDLNETVRKATEHTVQVAGSNFKVAAAAASEATQRVIEHALRGTKK